MTINKDKKYFMSLKNIITLYNSKGKMVQGNLLICDDAMTEHCVVYTITGGKIGFFGDKKFEDVGKFSLECNNVLTKQIIEI